MEKTPGKPEFYTIPPRWLELAKKVTQEGGYANTAPLKLDTSATMPDVDKQPTSQPDTDPFALGLQCKPKTPSEPGELSPGELSRH